MTDDDDDNYISSLCRHLESDEYRYKTFSCNHEMVDFHLDLERCIYAMRKNTFVKTFKIPLDTLRLVSERALVELFFLRTRIKIYGDYYGDATEFVDHLIAILGRRERTIEQCWGVGGGGVVGGNTTLVRLTLTGNPLDETRFGRLATALGRCSALKHLGLKQCGLTPACAPHIAALMGTCMHLRSLDLARNEIGTEGVTALFAALRAAPRVTYALDLHRIATTRTLAAHLVDEIVASLECGVLFSYLNVSRAAFGDNAIPLIDALVHSSSLHTIRELALNCTELTAACACSFSALIARAPMLSYLSLNDNTVGDVWAASVAIALGETTSLRTLWLINAGIEDEGMRWLYESLAIGDAYAKSAVTRALIERKIGQSAAQRFAYFTHGNVSLRALYINSTTTNDSPFFWGILRLLQRRNLQ